MALFHLSVTQTKRSTGQSAIASAAYRAGERLYSEYYGEYSDYTRKGGVICSDILLPSHAPPEYADRQTLWNAVEKAERGKNAQLAYSFDIALQNEFSLEENIALARQFLLENFVSRGMVVDFAVHQPDREDGGIPNPHFHVLCPIRPIEQNGKWGLKQRRVYELDEDGNRMRSSRPSCWKTAGALRWGITPLRPRPMSHGLAMMIRTASGSMNGGITAATAPLWNRTLRRGCRNTSVFTMSVSSRPKLPAFTSIIPPSAPWTLGHSQSRPVTPRTKLSTTISASRLKTDRFWRGGI